MSQYGFTKELTLSFDEAVDKVRSVLADEGFGILTEIDVQATMKKKLDKDMEEYLILGACNPPLASKAIDTEFEIGLLLPCNVIVYRKDNAMFASVLLPTVALDIAGNPQLEPLAQEAEKKLKHAFSNL